MSLSALLLAAAPAVPLAMALACIARPIRARMIDYLWAAPLPALAAALLVRPEETLVPLAFPPHAILALDGPGALLLGAAALLWIGAGIYARGNLAARPLAGRFSVVWLLALAGNMGVFIAADMASFYLFFAMASLAAFGLVVWDGTPEARRAGIVYVAFALLGEALVITGLALLAGATEPPGLLIRDAVAALPSSPRHNVILALLIAGFGLKIGLVPLHVWMPLAYRAAPLPAAAVLSGALVKSGVIGLIRFLPFGTAFTGWGEALAAVGFVAAFYGVAVGLTQSNPRVVLAYSSVSQMGLIAAVAGMGLATGYTASPTALAFYAAHHVLVKGALFLALGVAAAAGARTLWPVLLPAAIIALGLAGLPFSGGAFAKAALKGPLGEGMAATLAALSAAATTLLMIHFLQCLAVIRGSTAKDGERGGLLWSSRVGPWLGLALAAIVLPALLYTSAVPGARLADVVSTEALWSLLWPLLLGGALATALHQRRDVLPSLPEGDLVVLYERAAAKVREFGASFTKADETLRRWPVAGVSLLMVTILLGVALLGAR